MHQVGKNYQNHRCFSLLTRVFLEKMSELTNFASKKAVLVHVFYKNQSALFVYWRKNNFIGDFQLLLAKI
jgi:hypothetical protein